MSCNNSEGWLRTKFGCHVDLLTKLSLFEGIQAISLLMINELDLHIIQILTLILVFSCIFLNLLYLHNLYKRYGFKPN